MYAEQPSTVVPFFAALNSAFFSAWIMAASLNSRSRYLSKESDKEAGRPLYPVAIMRRSFTRTQPHLVLGSLLQDWTS